MRSYRYPKVRFGCVWSTFDGTIGDVISSWLTSTWESIKAAMRAIIPDALEPSFYKQEC